MYKLDEFEIGMYREKWLGVWFFVKDHDSFFAGCLGEVIRQGSSYLIVWATLFHSRGSKCLPVWIAANPTGPATFCTLTDKGQAALANNPLRTHHLSVKGLAIRTVLGKSKEYEASRPMSLDFSFPAAGLVTMLRGAHKGYSYYIRRIPNEVQLRGASPGRNLQLTAVDEDYMHQEGMVTLPFIDRDMKEHIYADLYYSLVHTKPLTIGEGIDILTKGQCVSVALNRKFALSLSRFHEEFNLLYGIADVGTVSQDGVVSLKAGSEDILLELQVA